MINLYRKKPVAVAVRNDLYNSSAGVYNNLIKMNKIGLGIIYVISEVKEISKPVKPCPICGEDRFANAAQARCHGLRNHESFGCTCGKKFLSQKALEDHKKQKKKNEKHINATNVVDHFRVRNN